MSSARTRLASDSIAYVIILAFCALSGRNIAYAAMLTFVLYWLICLIANPKRIIPNVFVMLCVIASACPIDIEVTQGNAMRVALVVVRNNDRQMGWQNSQWVRISDDVDSVHRYVSFPWPPVFRCLKVVVPSIKGVGAIKGMALWCQKMAKPVAKYDRADPQHQGVVGRKGRTQRGR
jgi:hypothetical protein